MFYNIIYVICYIYLYLYIHIYVYIYDYMIIHGDITNNYVDVKHLEWNTTLRGYLKYVGDVVTLTSKLYIRILRLDR